MATDARKVVVTGATGLIGRRLCQRLAEQGYHVIVFSRNPATARKAVPEAREWVAWEPTTTGPWASALDGVHGVVSLAGAPIIGKRWTDAYKREIRDSRVIGTRGLVDAIRAAHDKPRVFVGGSAIGYYGFRGDEKLDEGAAPGDDFLARVCVEWEAEALKAQELGVRVAVARTGVVLSTSEGALPQMLLPFKFFAGGPVLPGTQWVSWVHLEDEVGVILTALENDDARGPINATAPEPQRNRDFERTLGEVYGTPSWFPVPGVGLKLALGEVADMLTRGQRVIPTEATSLGYTFQYPTAEAALRNLLKK